MKYSSPALIQTEQRPALIQTEQRGHDKKKSNKTCCKSKHAGLTSFK